MPALKKRGRPKKKVAKSEDKQEPVVERLSVQDALKKYITKAAYVSLTPCKFTVSLTPCKMPNLEDPRSDSTSSLGPFLPPSPLEARAPEASAQVPSPSASEVSLPMLRLTDQTVTKDPDPSTSTAHIQPVALTTPPSLEVSRKRSRSPDTAGKSSARSTPVKKRKRVAKVKPRSRNVEAPRMSPEVKALPSVEIKEEPEASPDPKLSQTSSVLFEESVILPAVSTPVPEAEQVDTPNNRDKDLPVITTTSTSPSPVKSGDINSDNPSTPPTLNLSFKLATQKNARRLLSEVPSHTPSDFKWFCTVMWDIKVLEDLRAHDQLDAQLYTRLAIGKMLVDRISDQGESWPVLRQMSWRKPFFLLDVITNEFEKIGSCASLKVQETPTVDTAGQQVIWDLIIPSECDSIGREIGRRYPTAKTTVMIWNAVKTEYPQLRNGSAGEIRLKPGSCFAQSTLTVLIFHHEILDKTRGRQMHEPLPESELSHLQNHTIGIRYGMSVELEKIPTHLALHAWYETNKRNDEESFLDEPLVLIPEDGSDDGESIDLDAPESDKMTDEESWGEGEEQWDSQVDLANHHPNQISSSVPEQIHSQPELITPRKSIQQREVQSAGGAIQNDHGTANCGSPVDSQEMFLHTQELTVPDTQSQRLPASAVLSPEDTASFVSCVEDESQLLLSSGKKKCPNPSANSNSQVDWGNTGTGGTSRPSVKRSLLGSFKETGAQPVSKRTPSRNPHDNTEDNFQEDSQQYRFTAHLDEL